MDGAATNSLRRFRAAYIAEARANPARLDHVADRLYCAGALSREEHGALETQSVSDRARTLIDKAVRRGETVSAAFVQAWDSWNAATQGDLVVDPRPRGRPNAFRCPACGYAPLSQTDAARGSDGAEKGGLPVLAIVDHLFKLSEEDFSLLKWTMHHLVVSGYGPMKGLVETLDRKWIAETIAQTYPSPRLALGELLKTVGRNELALKLAQL